MLLRVMSEKGKYQTVYFALIDILGFKNILINNCKINPTYLLKIISEADDASSRGPWYGINKIFLSDSILMWTPHKNAIPYLLENCERLQEKLFLKGHLVRGAIVKGLHYSGALESLDTKARKMEVFPDHILVSPALVKAYTYEQSLSDPVIKCEGAVLNDVPKILKQKSSKNQKYKSNEFYFGRDYCGHFTYLHSLLDASDKSWNKELKKEVKHILNLRNMVEREIKNNSGSPKRKWVFVAKRFNACLDLIADGLKRKKVEIPRIKLR